MNTTEDAIDFNPVSTRLAEWNNDSAELKNLRRHSSVEETHPHDTLALHFISSLNSQSTACVTLLKTGEIVLLSILPEYSSSEAGSGPADALMRFILREAPKHSLTRLYTYCSAAAQALFLRYGFQWDADEKRLVIFLAPDRTHIASGDDMIILDTLDAFREHTLKLIDNAKRNLALFTMDLDPDIYNSSPVYDGILKLMKRSDRTEVRILVKNTQPLLAGGYELIKLYQRSATDQLQVKKLTVNPGAHTYAYLLSDDCGIIYQPSDAQYRGVCYHDNRGRVKTQLEEFDQLWNVAIEEPGLKQLSI